MYFSQAQAHKVSGNLRRALVDDGWLAVSASEGSQVLGAGFESGNFPGTLLYRKCEPKTRREPPLTRWAPTESAPPSLPMVPPRSPPALISTPPAARREPSPASRAKILYAEGRYEEASDVLLAHSAQAAEPEDYSLLARALANLGKLNEALSCCDQWLAADKLDAAAHYLRATVLQELGEPERARDALQRAIYLRPDIILAHFLLGNLALNMGRHAEAEKHFRNTLQLLNAQPPSEVLPESDGLTASRLTEIVQSFLSIATKP
jgi:chemotaxis protein methyltransferase CheR